MRIAAKRMSALVFFGVLPLAGLAAVIFTLHHSHFFGAYWDFRVYWNAGRNVLHGRSPYPPASTAVLARENAFVYPAPAALLFVPFALVPLGVSSVLFAIMLIVALPLALRIVGVRDLRCYGIALLSAPLFNAVGVDTISPLLVVPVAVAWRYRDRRWVAATALAVAVILKVFLWPLVVWFALTRRVATALRAVCLIVVSTVAAWAVLAFHGLRTYPHVLLLLDRLLDGKGYSLVALGRSLGMEATAARAIPWIAGALILAYIAFVGRRRGSEPQTYALAIGATLALSPIIWLHYFVLLFIPIALASERLSPIWFLPLALWVDPPQSILKPPWDKQKIIPLAHTARVGHWPLIVWAIIVSTGVVALSAWAARTRRVTPV